MRASLGRGVRRVLKSSLRRLVGWRSECGGIAMTFALLPVPYGVGNKRAPAVLKK